MLRKVWRKWRLQVSSANLPRNSLHLTRYWGWNLNCLRDTADSTTLGRRLSGWQLSPPGDTTEAKSNIKKTTLNKSNLIRFDLKSFNPTLTWHQPTRNEIVKDWIFGFEIKEKLEPFPPLAENVGGCVLVRPRLVFSWRLGTEWLGYNEGHLNAECVCIICFFSSVFLCSFVKNADECYPHHWPDQPQSVSWAFVWPVFMCVCWHHLNGISWNPDSDNNRHRSLVLSFQLA